MYKKRRYEGMYLLLYTYVAYMNRMVKILPQGHYSIAFGVFLFCVYLYLSEQDVLVDFLKYKML